jgi:hypothetical protein
MDIAAYFLRALRPYPLARFLAFLKKHRFNCLVNSPPWEDNSFVAKDGPPSSPVDWGWAIFVVTYLLDPDL